MCCVVCVVLNIERETKADRQEGKTRSLNYVEITMKRERETEIERAREGVWSVEVGRTETDKKQRLPLFKVSGKEKICMSLARVL